MIAYVDTNVLIRHLTGDPPAQAKRATRFLLEAEGLILEDVIVAEVVYVLETVYEQTRTDITIEIRALLALPSILAPNASILLRAIEIYETARIHFAEAYLAACATADGTGIVASFDQDLDRVATITRVEP